MSPTNNKFHDGILMLAGIAILLAVLRMASEIVVPFLLSLFIALVAGRPLGLLKRRGISTPFAIFIVMFAVVVIIALFSFILGGAIKQFNEVLPVYELRLDALMQVASVWLEMKGLETDQVGILDVLDPSAAMDFANYVVLGIGNVLSDFMLILFTVIFMLVESAEFPHKMSIIEGNKAGKMLSQLGEFFESINGYIVAKTAVSLVTGVLIWLALALIGLDFAPLWGFIAFMLNFVPTIGSIIASVPAILVATLQLDPGMVLVVLSIYVIVNTLIGNVVEPMLLGQKMGLSTLAIFLSLLFWGWMFGPVGMLLSVPLTMAIKFATHSNPQTEWVAVLLTPAPKAEKT